MGPTRVAETIGMSMSGAAIISVTSPAGPARTRQWTAPFRVSGSTDGDDDDDDRDRHAT
jgi:hypothetical protein